MPGHPFRAFFSPIPAFLPRMKKADLLAIRYRAASDLVRYERNARTHSAAQIEQIKASQRKFGWTIPALTAGASCWPATGGWKRPRSCGPPARPSPTARRRARCQRSTCRTCRRTSGAPTSSRTTSWRRTRAGTSTCWPASCWTRSSLGLAVVVGSRWPTGSWCRRSARSTRATRRGRTARRPGWRWASSPSWAATRGRTPRRLSTRRLAARPRSTGPACSTPCCSSGLPLVLPGRRPGAGLIRRPAASCAFACTSALVVFRWYPSTARHPLRPEPQLTRAYTMRRGSSVGARGLVQLEAGQAARHLETSAWTRQVCQARTGSPRGMQQRLERLKLSLWELPAYRSPTTLVETEGHPRSDP